MPRPPSLAFRLRHRIVEHCGFDLAPLGIVLVEADRYADRGIPVVGRQQFHPEPGVADASARVDPRAEHEPQMPRFGLFLELCDIGKRRDSGVSPPRHDDKPLTDQRPVHAGQRHHIGDGRERDQVQPFHKVRLVMAFAGRAELPDRAGFVQPVRIYDRNGIRQFWFRHVMVHDHHVESGRRRVSQRPERGGAAIDRDNQRHAFVFQLQQGGRVRTVALGDAVWHINGNFPPDRGEKPGQQGAGTGSVHVVICENTDLLAGIYGRDDAFHRPVHAEQVRRVRQQVPQLRVEKRLRPRHVHAARREDTPQGIGQVELLRDCQRGTIV